MPNFWKKLNRLILALAPMAGYTNSSFRQICKKYGAGVVYSDVAIRASLSELETSVMAAIKNQI